MAVTAVLAMVGLLMALAVNPAPLEGVPREAPRPDRPTVASPAADAPGGDAGPVRPGVPVQLRIPVLDVDAPIVPITLESAVLTPPDDPAVLGWWNDGAAPGAPTGTALVTGHTVHDGGGALDDLEDVARGDRVVIESARGRADFTVGRVTVLSKEELAAKAEDLFSQSVAGRLVLVTCEDWNGTAYESNVVVIAQPA